MVTCALCGFTYEPGGESCRGQHCPLAWSGCHIAHCPRCGYTAPDEARGLAGWLSRLLPAEEPAAVARLSEVKPGRAARVERLEAPPDVAAQLTLLGFTAGTRVTLQQRFPAYVVDVDGVDVALERSVAEAIWVKTSLARR
jgi:Fe2+ transport system protein FeoA